VRNPSSGASSSSAEPSSNAPAKRAGGKKRAKVTVPEVPGSARVIAIANQKGGVGKSTTAVSLGACLAELGFRVLVVDLDPQGNASTGMGIRHENRGTTTYDVLVGEAPIAEAIVASPVKGLFAVPSTIDLAGADIELVSQFSREGRLKRALEAVHEGSYDFIFLDCPPSLGLITVNALTAAEELIVPIQCEYYALEGLGQLLRNVSLVQQNINPELRLTGIVMTMFDPRTKLSEQVVEEVQRHFRDLVYDTIIPRTVRLSEAPGYGVPITLYDPKSKGAECYRELAREVALRPPPATPMPAFEDLPVVVAPQVMQEPVGGGPIPDDALDEETPTVHEVLEEAAAPAEPVQERPTDPPAEPRAKPSRPKAAAPKVAEQKAPVAAPARSQAARVEAPNDEDEIWEAPEAEQARVRPLRDSQPPGELPRQRVVVIDESTADRAGAEQSDQAATKEPPSASLGGTLHDEDDGQRRRWRLFRKGGE
jgi:chromosome partitioning protein